MGITVAVKVEHLALPKILVGTGREQSGLVLVPNLDHTGAVRDTVKSFIKQNFFIGDEFQVLESPLFRTLSEKESVEEIYRRYACQAEVDIPDIHVDEDSFAFFAREGGKTIELEENRSLEDYHILDKTVLQLRTLPQPLPEQGGRIFVETKDGILPLLGVTYRTQVLELKHVLERMTGIPADKQLLSSVGRIMHDDFCMKDFDGPYRVCEDSTLDLCKSGDSNLEQAHKRMVISINVMGEQTFTMVVQSRDLVQSVLQLVEARTGVTTWQQRVTFSGKVLHEKKTLSEYYVHPDCTLQVTIFKSPCKPPPKTINRLQSGENSGVDEQRPAARKIKLLRTCKGRSNGSITIPVLTSDTVSDLRRKVRRTLQPLTERNFLILHSPAAEQNCGPRKPSPSPSNKGSESGRRLSRVLSFTGKNFSGQLFSTTSPATSTSCSVAQSPEEHPGHGSSFKPVARVLSFKNFSGPLVVSPRKGVQPTPAPLFPPPLTSPRASPAKAFGCNRMEQLKENNEASLTTTGENEISSLSASPRKREQFSSHACPGHIRTASAGSMHFMPEAHSLPVQPSEPIVSSPVQLVSISSSTTPMASKKSSQFAPGSEKKGLGAWLTDSMHSLKEHIRAPFAERN